MAGQINLQPQVLDLFLYSGDGFAFKLICTDSDDAPIDMGGTVKAQVRLDRLNPDDPPVAEFAIGMTDAYQGIIVLSLSGSQTQGLTDNGSVKKFDGVWDVEWDPPSAERRTICQGRVECVADVTR